MVWDDEKYYMVAYCEKRKSIINFRVDRMDSVEITDDPVRPLPDSFEFSEYLGATFSMFAGEAQEVKLRFDNDLINAVLDRFGKDIKIVPCDDEHFTIHAKVKVQPPFFGWLFQFGKKASILSPDNVVEEYKQMLNNTIQNLE